MATQEYEDMDWFESLHADAARRQHAQFAKVLELLQERGPFPGVLGLSQRLLAAADRFVADLVAVTERTGRLDRIRVLVCPGCGSLGCRNTHLLVVHWSAE